MLVLSRDEVRELLDLDALIDALADAMVDLSAGRASVPERIAALVPERDALLAAMPGYVPSLGALVSKLVSLFPRNAGSAIATHQAVIAVFDPQTGSPVALLDGTAPATRRPSGALPRPATATTKSWKVHDEIDAVRQSDMTNPAQSPTTVSNIGVAMFTIANQDAAISYYTQTLGWELRADVPFGDEGGNRWVEVAPPGSIARLALNPPMREWQPGGSAIGVETSDVNAEYARILTAAAIP